ncbi:MAG: metalloregulator ArsR/SmtB family transcription factor [Chloroflexota bacterium]
MAHRAFKDRLYVQFARLGSALSSPRRLELLDLLAQGERSVEELALESSMSMGSASQHLGVLREAQLVVAQKRGLRVYYRLAAPEVFTLFSALRSTADRQLAEIDRLVGEYLGHRGDLDAIDKAELLRRMRDGTAVMIDARPIVEYRQGHIAGALSIPIDELAQRLGELPAGHEIVAYCRGPYCVYADEAVTLLRERGISAVRLEDGYPEWAAAGHPTERGQGRYAVSPTGNAVS